MRRENAKPYFLILLALGFILSLSPLTSEKIRTFFVESLSTTFEQSTTFKLYFSDWSQEKVEISSSLSNVSKITTNEEIKRLELENKLLYANFIQLLDLVDNTQNALVSSQAVTARVIFRSPNSWFSSLWINVGEDDNATLKFRGIDKNSPVLVGSSIIGVIDYVGKKQSRVRLITDSALKPSVRATRRENEEVHYLAKGELRGSGKPLFRSNGNLLLGIGFNYDFSDDKGPSRDLRTGEISHNKTNQKNVPLLKVNDLLVTTGMDGVFPPDLNVAKITKIYPLKEGDYYYELEAEPACGKLDDLSLVFVLPPVGFDFNDKPPLIGH